MENRPNDTDVDPQIKGLSPKSDQPILQIETKTISCPKCMDIFQTVNNLRYHDRTRHSDAKHECGVCKTEAGLALSFATSYSLKRHNEFIHKGPFICDECTPPQLMDNKHRLRDHKAEEHPNKDGRGKKRRLHRRFSDSSTGKRFRTKKDLSDFVDDQAWGAPIDYQPSTDCPYCPAHFTERTSFLDHINVFHREDIGLVDEDPQQKDAAEAILRNFVAFEKPDSKVNDEEDLYEALLELMEDSPLKFCHPVTPTTISGVEGHFRQTNFQIHLNNKGRAAGAFGLSLALVKALLTHLLSKVSPNRGGKSKVQIEVTAPSLSWPVTMPFAKYDGTLADAREIVDQFLAQLSLVLTSKQELIIDEGFQITISAINMSENKLPDDLKIGGGSSARASQNASLRSFVMRKRDNTSIPQSVHWENDCLLSAVYMSLWHKEDPDSFNNSLAPSEPWGSTKLRNGMISLNEEMHKFLRLPNPIDWDMPQSTPTLILLQQYLNTLNYQLIVYRDVSSANPVFRGAPQRPLNRQLSLVFIQNKLKPNTPGHVYMIHNPEAFFKAKYCHPCVKLYPNKSKHNFELCSGHVKICPVCRTRECYIFNQGKEDKNFNVDDISQCIDCQGLFTDNCCFQQHKKPVFKDFINKSVCELYIHCKVCGIRRERSADKPGEVPEHNCGKAKCKNCLEYFSSFEGKPHYCSVRKASRMDLGTLERSPNEKIPSPTVDNIVQTYPSVVGKKAIVFFDYETRQNPEGRLIPFALVAYFMCSKCCFIDFMKPEKWPAEYACCGRRKRKYVGMKEMKDFVQHLFYGVEFRRNFSKVHAWAFNGSRFDFLFITDMLISNGHMPLVKMQGRNVIYLKYNNVVLKDLCVYIPATLSSLPKTFQFADKVEKGFFPHKLSNIVDNDYRSDIWPDRVFYQPHLLRSVKEQEELDIFLASKQGEAFEFLNQCLMYCDQDVLILALATLSLELATLQETGFEISFIHSKSFTVASLSTIYYRHLFMRAGSIGLVPPNGYANMTNVQSLAAEMYFLFLNDKRRSQGLEEIRYNRSSIYGEYKLGSLKLDGVTEDEIFEYDSCFHHACERCYKGKMNQTHPLYKTTYSHVRYLDLMRKFKIRSATKKKLTIIRHCEVDQMLKDPKSEFRIFFDREKDLQQPTHHINIRDSLFGGRVENLAVVVELTPSEIIRGVEIKYADVVSEYPYVQYTKKFPTRLHPTVINGRDLLDRGANMSIQEAERFFGIFSVFIVPPIDCLFPTVPFRSGERTLYGLCATCMKEGSQNICHHTDDRERGWQATLTSPDLEQALEDGFRVLYCSEILDWGAGETTTELFAENIRQLIKGKVQSKPGAENLSLEEKTQMIKAWGEIGVSLQQGEWRGNPARYQFYKLMLNSLWGKLAQNPILKATKFVQNWEGLKKIVENETKDLFSVHLTDSDVLICQTKEIGDHISVASPFFNPFIASLVTSYARLHITSFIRGIGYGSPYYLDTDSLIYKSDPKENGRDPPLDDNKLLGSLVSEVPQGLFIKKIVVLAPKSYVYTLFSKADPLSEEPVETVNRMKGISLRAGIQCALTVPVLEKLALAQLVPRDSQNFKEDLMDQGFYHQLSSDGLSNALSIPQPRLTKSLTAFQIFSNEKFTKILQSRFNKRFLQIPRLFKDMNETDNLYDDIPFHPSHYPSLPFGFKCPFLGNA